MIWETYGAALASLIEFSPEMRARHQIVKFWSHTRGQYRYARTLKTKGA